jgi:hypothetical protein
MAGNGGVAAAGVDGDVGGGCWITAELAATIAVDVDDDDD